MPRRRATRRVSHASSGGEKRKGHERVCDPAVILHDSHRIARGELGDDVNVGKYGSESCCKCCHASLAVRKETFPKKRSGDAVCYRVHSDLEKGAVYTIRSTQAIWIKGDCFSNNFADNSGGNISRLQCGERALGRFGRLSLPEDRLMFAGHRATPAFPPARSCQNQHSLPGTRDCSRVLRRKTDSVLRPPRREDMRLLMVEPH